MHLTGCKVVLMIKVMMMIGSSGGSNNVMMTRMIWMTITNGRTGGVKGRRCGIGNTG